MKDSNSSENFTWYIEFKIFLDTFFRLDTLIKAVSDRIIYDYFCSLRLLDYYTGKNESIVSHRCYVS